MSLDAAYAKVEMKGGLIAHGGAGAGFASAVRLSQTCVTRRIQQCAPASGARSGGTECENQDGHRATAVGVGADRVGSAA
jgi:hypothetical protein